MTDKPLTAKNLTDYFTQREEAISSLDGERERLAQRCLDLMPEEIATYRSVVFHDIGRMVNFLQNLYDRRKDVQWPNDNKIKEPSDYGFKDYDDAFKKMMLLKKAWKGLIDMNIDKDSSWYVFVEFRLPIQEPK